MSPSCGGTPAVLRLLGGLTLLLLLLLLCPHAARGEWGPGTQPSWVNP